MTPLIIQESQLFENLKTNLPEGFQYGEFEKTKAVVALFTGAPGIGPLKVYPVAEDYIIENKLTRKGGVIEIYEIFDKRAMQTTYIWPVVN